jgi:hypothetical protein
MELNRTAVDALGVDALAPAAFDRIAKRHDDGTASRAQRSSSPQLLEAHRKAVCPPSRGGSPYTAPSRVARRGRADPHRRKTSRGPCYRGFRRDRRVQVAQCHRGRGRRAWPLQPQLDQLLLAQSFQLAAAHLTRESAKSAPGKRRPERPAPAPHRRHANAGRTPR